MAVFRNTLYKMKAKQLRPPTKKHLGKNLRQVKPFMTTPEVFQEALLEARGMHGGT